MEKMFVCKRVVYNNRKKEDEVIEEYPPMTEEEFFEFGKQFICKVDFSEYNAVFIGENSLKNNIKYIKENGYERWSLGNNPNKDIGFEDMIVELKECDTNEHNIKK